jgi:hypothetical protein
MMNIREHLASASDYIMDMAEECGRPYLWITAVVAGLILAAVLTIYYLTR